MTQRKFRDTTRGGYPVRNMQRIENAGSYAWRAEIGVPKSLSLGAGVVWTCETFTEQGRLLTWRETKKDLIEVTE